MPYLDNVIIHNFKSFKHANIKFSKGFNCIVGANGSGKSNICDSLLFALGETSLRRMRVPNSSQLINSLAKPKKEDGIKRAYVRINFLAKDPLEISRVIKSNNKIGYRLNGKHATRQEIVDALHGFKSEINETNIIAQGEIQNMISLNAKERRELIDIAAGIKAFNYKKDSAIKELEIVQEKINETKIALNERNGFLEQLGREKEDAEKYMQLAESIKRINYTLLKSSELQVESDFNKVTDMLKSSEQKNKTVSNVISELDIMVEKLSSERNAHSNSLNERSVELSGTNSLLESMRREQAVKEEQMRSLREKLQEFEKLEAQLKDERKKLQDECISMSKELGLSQKLLEEKANNLSTKEAVESNEYSRISKVGQNQKRIEELYVQSENLSGQHLQCRFEIEETEKLIKTSSSAIQEMKTKYGTVSTDIEKYNGLIFDSEKRILAHSNDIDTFNAELKKHQKVIDDIYVESVNLREQMSAMGATGIYRINEALKKDMGKEFHGRAYELCEYDEKYVLAVNAAAANRLNYLVVDSAQDADSAIRILKSKQLGRASFIPISDIETRNAKDFTSKLDRMIDHIKFKKEYGPVFNYIFSNTYIVKDIEQAKVTGFGKGRFVTLEGELVELSGVITGGYIKNMQSPAMLESKLKALDSKKFLANSEISKANSAIEASRKDIAALQSEGMSHKVELRHLEAERASLRSDIESSQQKSDELKKKLSILDAAYKAADSRREAILDELNAFKVENDGIYAMSEMHPNKQRIAKTEMEKIKSMRSEVEQLKIRTATFSRELELKNARLAELNASIKSKDDVCTDSRKKIAILDNDVQELSKSIKELQEKIGKSDSNSRELYKKLQELEGKLAILSKEKGSHQLELEKAGRSIVEQETKRVQLQTRISDIKAEMMSYQGIEFMEGLSQNELEAKRSIAKSDIERLGAVNLKAPEVYIQKKKDVDEVKSKMDVLSNEKESIMAMIGEIESKKLNVFMETFNDVNSNFQKLYGYIFEGSALLQLENAKEPFNSGLLVKIKSPKNANSSIEVLSGGEKTLVIIMLIFAIQAHNPMSLYLFDEIDASLDKENSKKLSKLMKEVSRKSQLIVISHNDSLISAADTAIGVVHRSGESRVVGLQLTPVQSIEAK